jgi:hypothetical protein
MQDEGISASVIRTTMSPASDEASFITGSTLSVNGGQHMY